MTKKDYELIAGEVRFIRQAPLSDSAFAGIDLLTENLSKALAADNPRFSRSRFLAACRGEDSKDSAGRKVTYANR